MLPIFEHTLANRLRVVLQPDETIPVVGLAVFYDVGSRNEVPGRSGFAHLFEHMMFQGSEHVGKTEHFRLIQSWGGDLNGTTGQNHTNYYESLPSHQLGLGLWLEADRMRALAVTPENFENQRQTVMEERRQVVDNRAYGPAMVRLGEISFDCWAYAHPVIGSWEDLDAAQFDEVVDFHRTWYRPDNAVLVLTGDFERKTALDQINALFSNIPPGGDRPVPDLNEPRRVAPKTESLVDPLAELPCVLVNHQAPDCRDPRFFTWEVIETLLFRGPASRVWRRLVIDESIAIHAGGGYEAHRGPSLFGLSAVVPRGGDIDRIVKAYHEELARLATEPVSDEELDKAYNQLRSARIFGQENVLNRALGLGRSALYYNDSSWEEAYLSRVRAVRAADICREAATMRMDNRVELRVQTS